MKTTARNARPRRDAIGRMEQLERREMLAVSIVRTTENQRFTIDTTSIDKSFVEYQAFKVTNTSGAPLTNLWVKATGFAPTEKVQLAPNEDGLYYIGDLAPGAADTAFFYLQATAVSTTTPDFQTYTIQVWDHAPPLPDPAIPGDAPIDSEDFEFLWVAAADENNDGSVTNTVSVSYSFGGVPVTGPVVGGEIKVTVTGEIKNNADRVLFMPATSLAWPADTFELRDTNVSIDGVPLGEDIIWQQFPDRKKRDFIAEYTFAINGTTASPTRVTPREYTAIGDIGNRKFDHSRLVDGVADIPPPVFQTALEITKTGPATAVAGSAVPSSYVITVTSTGISDSTGVVVTDTWPAGFTKQTISPPAGTSIINETATGFQWVIGTLAAGTSIQLEVDFTVPITTALGPLTNTAVVASTTPNPNPDTATATTTVVGVPLTITKVGDAATVQAGTGGHWYRITVTNTSGFTAENVTVTDAWPAGFTQVSFSDPGAVTPLGGGNFLWTIGSLAPLATVQLQVNFDVPSTAALKLYSNFATVSSTTLNPGDKTAEADTLVVGANLRAGFVICTDDGCSPAWVRVFDADGNLISEFQPYGNIRGGLRVTAADVNGDGVEEVIVAPGLGVRKPVRVLSTTGAPVPGFPDFFPYGTKWRNGIELAAADINNDGREDIITGMSLGIGTVNVYRVNGGLSLVRSFRGAPAGYAGGVRIAAADFGTYQNGVLVSPTLDGKAEVVVGTNAGIRAQVRIVDIQPSVPVVARTILPFGPAFKGGVSLSTGNYDGDPAHIPDILVGAGIGGRSVVKVFNAQTGTLLPGGTVTSFSSFSKSNAVVNVAPVDFDFDGTIDRLYGVQGRGGAGGTKGVRRVMLPSFSATQLTTYAPAMRIAPISLSASLMSRAAGARVQ